MFELLTTALVTGFVLVAIVGHVMVFKAMMKPDQTA